MDDKQKPTDSPYQDAKDFKAAVGEAAKKLDDFTTHSTSKVIGPLATKSINGIKRWWSTPRPLPAKRNERKPSFLASVFGWFGQGKSESKPSVLDTIPPLEPLGPDGGGGDVGDDGDLGDWT